MNWNCVIIVIAGFFFLPSTKAYYWSSSTREWTCSVINDRWGDKTWVLEEQDFCESWWDALSYPSHPDCNDKVAPTILFFDGTEDLCSIDMNKDKDDEFDDCITMVAGDGTQDTWLVYIIHGFTDGPDEPLPVPDWYLDIEDGIYARYGNDRRVITGRVIWTYGARNLGWDRSLTEHRETDRIAGYCDYASAYMGYPRAASNTIVVGHLLGVLTDFIVASNAIQTYCIGHSLGGQTCGFTGKTHKLDGIIGMDAAGPIFEKNSFDYHLNKNDAKKVYAVHTDADDWGYGIIQPVGNIDYYPNGGDWQPGCDSFTDVGNSEDISGCSHQSVHALVSHIMRNSAQGDFCFEQYTCTDQEHALDGECVKVTDFSEIGEELINLETVEDDDNESIIYFDTDDDELSEDCKFVYTME